MLKFASPDPVRDLHMVKFASPDPVRDLHMAKNTTKLVAFQMRAACQVVSHH